jgi:hypothetical protein
MSVSVNRSRTKTSTMKEVEEVVKDLDAVVGVAGADGPHWAP